MSYAIEESFLRIWKPYKIMALKNIHDYTFWMIKYNSTIIFFQLACFQLTDAYVDITRMLLFLLFKAHVFVAIAYSFIKHRKFHFIVWFKHLYFKFISSCSKVKEIYFDRNSKKINYIFLWLTTFIFNYISSRKITPFSKFNN